MFLFLFFRGTRPVWSFCLFLCLVLVLVDFAISLSFLTSPFPSHARIYVVNKRAPAIFGNEEGGGLRRYLL